MPELKMNSDEINIDLPLARRLIRRQFPQWADLPMAEVRSAGTDNVIYRLGNEMTIRLPRRPGVAAGVATEQRWLPRFSALLPLAVPVPLAHGHPAEGFPFPWSVYRWLDGENVGNGPEVDRPDAAVRLGRFVAALQRIDPSGGPPPPFRGGPVSGLDDRVRREIRDLGAAGTLDPDLVNAAWETAVAAPAWGRAPVWVHTDLYPGNLLARHGRLAAVIDFGGLGISDPAVDMLPAWAWLTAETRDQFRAEIKVDDATWARGRGWALSLGIGAAHFYRLTNPVLAAVGQHAIAEVVTDFRRQQPRKSDG